jgi:hypothetical protein
MKTKMVSSTGIEEVGSSLVLSRQESQFDSGYARQFDWM